VIGGGELKIDLAKMEAILKWSIPTYTGYSKPLKEQEIGWS
jgi:hypothetical protein